MVKDERTSAIVVTFHPHTEYLENLAKIRALRRNKACILRFYGKTFPRLIVPTLREFVTIPLKIALMEDGSLEKIKMFVRGPADGVAGRMGRLRHAE